MSLNSSFPGGATALLLIDPYNDFLSDGGKLASMAKEVLEAVGRVANMKAVVASCRGADIPVVYVPHHRARPTDFSGWRHPTPYQLGGHKLQVFAEGSWGGEWHPEFVPHADDVIVKEHWSGSGFHNTDLDLQLKQRGISHIIVIGLLANTCIETTAKVAVELGYHVTLVNDATSAFTHEALKYAHEINGPTFAHSIVSSRELMAQ